MKQFEVTQKLATKGSSSTVQQLDSHTTKAASFVVNETILVGILQH